MFKKKKKSTYKWPLGRKVIACICIIYIIGFSSFLFLFYGPINSFKEFWISSAMTTMSHQYLATALYSDKTIQEVLQNNSIIEPTGKTNTIIKSTLTNISTTWKIR